MEKQYDVIVVGSGLAGIITALELDKTLNIALITNGRLQDSNSYLAQGGICIPLTANEVKIHIEDTMLAGHEENDEEVVRHVSNSALDVLATLENHGVRFDRDENGYQRTKEGGHNQNIIMHAGGDATGENIMKPLIYNLRKSNVDIFENEEVLDIKTENNRVTNIITDKNNFKTKAAVIAAGGVGGKHVASTNESTVNGKWTDIAKSIGLEFRNESLVQYHPTGFFNNDGSIGLVSEAVRGEGAILLNEARQRFMIGKHELNELAPRDIVVDEMKKQEQVFLDASCVPNCKERFPTIWSNLLLNGIHMNRDLIPVVAVQHYYIGGVITDHKGRTNIDWLHVVGESASTNLHGKNRLASNSLLECCVFALATARSINKWKGVM